MCNLARSPQKSRRGSDRLGSTFRRVFGTTDEPSARDLDDDEGSPEDEYVESSESWELPTDDREVSVGVG